jgi:RNA polymerase sigma-70 factor (ECF subfamily)
MDSDSKEVSDIEIIRRVNGGDTDAFAVLLERHKGHVCRIAKKHVPFHRVEEISQDVFIRIFRSLGSFKGEGGFRQWISKITVRTCYDFWRKEYRNRELPMSSLTDRHEDWLEVVTADSSGEAFERACRKKEAGEVLEWALDRMTPEDRMVLELVHLEGLSGREVAELTGWSIANVKIRAYRSRNKLRKLLGESVER